MGDSRGRWEGDTLVVDVSHHNDKTWFDMAGNFHSEALHLVERYTMLDADTIQYEVTIEDPKVFTRPWKISMPLYRQQDMDRILEYQCQAEEEEANGDFEREPRTWYPGPEAPTPALAFGPPAQRPQPWKAPDSVRRTADGKPDLNGFCEADGGGANYGLEAHPPSAGNLTPPGRGVISDPADGKLPFQPWARDEREDRETPIRGYDDPTAHCFPAGVPRSVYVPVPFHIIQTPDTIVTLHERTSWRVIALDRTRHLPDTMRLWQGDSLGRWDGRYAGRRHDELQRENMGQRSGRRVQPRRTCHRTLHAGGRRHDSIRGDDHRSACLHAAIHHFHAAASAEERPAGGRVPRRGPRPARAQESQGPGARPGRGIHAG